MKRMFLAAGIALFLFASIAGAEVFTLKSDQIGGQLTIDEVYSGFGCTGKNISPQLKWTNAPKNTKSFALTVYDPDAPTGSGWWHWVVYDIPAKVTSLPTGVVVKEPLPAGAKQGRNDYGERNFGGACPPQGDRPHHYVFTVHALKVEKLAVPDDASPALIGFMIQSNRLGLARLTATYSR